MEKQLPNKKNKNYFLQLIPLGYTHDWNRVITLSRIPALRPASTIVALMPILQQIATFIPISIQNAWLLWISSLFFVAGFLMIQFLAPIFIRDFKYYSSFQAQGHSHRWIIWRFKYAFSQILDKRGILEEAVKKKIAVKVSELVYEYDNENIVIPVRNNPSSDFELADEPVQFARDIFLHFWIGEEAYVLPAIETDKNLQHKSRELFWIIYTDLAGSRPTARMITWIFFYIAFICLGLSFINNVLKVLCATF